MDNEKKQMYTARITQANGSELVVITYEIIEECIREASQYLESRKRKERETTKAVFEQEIERARKLLNEMMGSLDFRYEISFELLNLYRYADKELAKALFQQETEPLEHAARVLAILKEGFQEVSKQDNTQPVMENTQKLYAGLTYGKHSLNEVFVNVNETSRGFKA